MVALLAACGDDEDDDTRLAVAQTTTSFESFSGIDFVADTLLAPDADLAALGELEARMQAIADAQARLALALNAFTCASPAAVTTDGATWMEAVIDDCRSDIFGRFDGHWRADLDLETVACAAGMCPTSVLWTLSSPEPPRPALIGGPIITMTIVQPVRFNFSVDPTGDRTLEVERYHIDSPDARLAARVSATWRRIDGCVIGADIDATITQQVGHENPDLESNYPIVQSARDLSDCPAACPTAGQIFLSYANGLILMWSYDGDDRVRALGPNGYALDVFISCG